MIIPNRVHEIATAFAADSKYPIHDLVAQKHRLQLGSSTWFDSRANIEFNPADLEKVCATIEFMFRSNYGATGAARKEEEIDRPKELKEIFLAMDLPEPSASESVKPGTIHWIGVRP